MSQNKDFRKQTSVPTTPTDTDKVVMYANASGQLNVVNSNGTVSSVAGAFSQNVSQVGGSFLNLTGSFFQVGIGIPSGAFYGTTGGPTAINAIGNLSTLLAAPAQWLVAIGPSGQKLVVPGYAYV